MLQINFVDAALNNMPIFFPEDLGTWSGGSWSQYPMAPIEGVSHDTRTLLPGNLYIAIKGDQFDGHGFVSAAFERGAGAAMVSEPFALSFMENQPLLVVEDTRIALQNLARQYVSSLNVRRFGITGSVGKTTVKELIADIMAHEGATARTLGNWNNDIGLPLSLLSMWKEDRYGVFEIGMNHPGELEVLCDILQPNCGVMTPIGTVHREFFESEEAIAQEKAALFRALPADGVAVISSDLPYFDCIREQTRARIVTVSFDESADYCGTPEGADLRVVEPNGTHQTYTMPLPGGHFMRDALLAVAAAREQGVSPMAIAAALRAFKPLSMRWHRQEVNGVQVVNDSYNANPMSMEAALRTFEEMPSQGRKWLVLAGMNELGDAERSEHMSLGRKAAMGTWNVVTVGKLGRVIAEGARQGGMSDEQVTECSDAEEAGRLLSGGAQAGDAVLLKGSRGEQLEKVLRSWQDEQAAG